MTNAFRLHAHEVWREKLVREGTLAQSGDFAEVLPRGVWPGSRFCFGRYNPLRGHEGLVGHVVFRPEEGPDDENFFVALDVDGDAARGKAFCKLGEFVFGNDRVDDAILKRALQFHQWGRVFYLDDQGLRQEEQERPCDWGVFLAANGWGLWKWSLRDGVTWGKASGEGVFRWNKKASEAAQMLAQSSSHEVWRRFERQLTDPNFDGAFARRWLQTEEEERFDLVVEWARGSKAEFDQVVGWLLMTHPSLQNAQTVSVMLDLFDTEPWSRSFQCDKQSEAFPSWLEKALSKLTEFFGPRRSSANHPCIERSFVETSRWILVSPSAHERLEAHQQLTQWARERGLSFD